MAYITLSPDTWTPEMMVVRNSNKDEAPEHMTGIIMIMVLMARYLQLDELLKQCS